MDKELYKNGSGYADPTAYEAMKGWNKMDVRKFEIWSYSTMNGNEREGIIIASDERHVVMLGLLDNPCQGAIAVPSKHGEMYVHPLKLCYCTSRNLGEYVQNIPDMKAEEIWTAFLESFGVPKRDAENAVGNEVRSCEYVSEITEQDLRSTQVERDIYIGLYRELLDKLTK